MLTTIRSLFGLCGSTKRPIGELVVDNREADAAGHPPSCSCWYCTQRRLQDAGHRVSVRPSRVFSRVLSSEDADRYLHPDGSFEKTNSYCDRSSERQSTYSDTGHYRKNGVLRVVAVVIITVVITAIGLIILYPSAYTSWLFRVLRGY